MIFSGAGTTVVLTRNDAGLPYISYWGPRIHASDGTPQPHISIDDTFHRVEYPQLLGAALQRPEFPSLLPTQAEAWSSTPLLSLSRNGIEVFPAFITNTITCTDTQARIQATSSDTSLDLTIIVEIHEGGLVSQKATLTNHGEEVQINRLWLTFPVPANANEVLSHTGHHLRERAPQRQPLTEGFFAKESWTGRPDFHTSLLMTVGTRGFDFSHGRCYSAHVGWSGNVTHFVTRSPYSQTLIGGGELLQNGEVTLQDGESYTTPSVYASWGDGLNEVSHRFHQFLRTTHGRPLTRRRPITLNTWEAVYFQQDEATLKALATAASDVGVERFVVDDGWFTGRRNDQRALGDWTVDTSVWPNGLEPLAEHIHSLGMEFGLWFEPEMISPDSQLATAHPDWIVAPNASRLPLEGRHQQVLDLSNPAAEAYIFESISALVQACGIDYIKWDHNRFLSEALSPYTGRPATHTQVLALYRLLDRLQDAHPGLEIESCSSGGGRVDLGILTRTQRIWASDCTDPLERIRIQQHTSLLVPPEMQGAHVADSPSHITGRESTIDTRVAAAFLEHFGVEWNLLKAPEADVAALRQWITELKKWRDAEGTGTMWHSSISDPALRVDGLISADGSRGVYRFAVLETSSRYPFDVVTLEGLDPNATYRVAPLGDLERLKRMENPQSSNSPLAWWHEGGATVSGAVLSDWGLRLPMLNPEAIVLFTVERVG